MDMWNWLMDCYKEGSLTLAELESAIEDDMEAMVLWKDFSLDSADFIEYVRDEIWPFIQYLKKKELCKKD